MPSIEKKRKLLRDFFSLLDDDADWLIQLGEDPTAVILDMLAVWQWLRDLGEETLPSPRNQPVILSIQELLKSVRV